MDANEISLASGRFQSCLREIRIRADDIEDEEKGLKISKKDWKKLHVQIASYNNFPTAASLACLVFALAKLMNVKEDHGQLSAIARQGSGSACRSLFGGFVKWEMGSVSSRQKETSSTSGMRDSVETSLLLKHRAEVNL
ncbi:hypothetical protein V2J09_000845 [Rumex salicifolius]